MDPFMIGLNIVCGLILIAYIIHGIRRKKRIKEAAASEKNDKKEV